MARETTPNSLVSAKMGVVRVKCGRGQKCNYVSGPLKLECVPMPMYYTHAVLIIDTQTTVSLQCVLCTFDISILHQVSLLGKIDPAEYPSNLAPSRAGMLVDVEV